MLLRRMEVFAFLQMLCLDVLGNAVQGLVQKHPIMAMNCLQTRTKWTHFCLYTIRSPTTNQWYIFFNFYFYAQPYFQIKFYHQTVFSIEKSHCHSQVLLQVVIMLQKQIISPKWYHSYSLICNLLFVAFHGPCQHRKFSLTINSAQNDLSFQPVPSPEEGGGVVKLQVHISGYYLQRTVYSFIFL